MFAPRNRVWRTLHQGTYRARAGTRQPRRRDGTHPLPALVTYVWMPSDASRSGDPDGPEAAGEPSPNHGTYVSEAAKNRSTVGRAHERAVSEVVRGDQGKPGR